MTNVIHTLPFLPSVGTNGPTTGVIQSPPLTLTRLAAGTVIEGTVTGQPAKGQVSVQTLHGQFALRTSAALATGTKVALQLQPSGGQVRVLVIPGQAGGAPPTPAGGNPAPAPAAPTAPTPPTGGTPAPATAGTPAPAGAATPSGPIGGTPVGGTPIGGTPIGGTPAGGTPVGTGPAAGPPAGGAATGATPTSGASVTGTPVGGTPVTGAPATGIPAPGAPATGAPTTISTPAPAGTTHAPPSGVPAAAQSGTAPTGQPATPTATTGTTATSTSATPTPTTPAPAIPGTIGAEVVPLARIMPGFEQALEAIARANPQAARALVQSVIPQPGPQLAGSIALLMNALGSGSIRGWLGGNALADLARTRGQQAMTNLADDFQQLSRIARSDLGEWRAYVLPFHDGERMQPIRLYVKPRQRGAGGPPDEESPARFVFEIELSRLGQIQLDGLATERRFDLMVRSKAPLPPHVRADIRALYAQLRVEQGLIGDVAFQVVLEFSVAPLEDTHELNSGLLA